MTPCIPWVGTEASGGYGRPMFRGRRCGAHQVMYELVYGPIPDGLVVRHACDWPPCINPLHLLLGTQQQNIEDMVERGRHSNGRDKIEKCPRCGGDFSVLDRGERRCRPCYLAYQREYNTKRKTLTMFERGDFR